MEHGHDLKDGICPLDWWHGTKLFQRNNAGGMGKPRLEQFKEWENRHEFRQGKIFGYKK